ncbi:hypothetical protein ACFUNF_40785 [Streptomyces sp. NPDC057291]|uniref:hypothetical protein n=1 Tax=Streptomyces sp. NPDC057291 TaxID=3346087 RepID=UPI00362AA942
MNLEPGPKLVRYGFPAQVSDLLDGWLFAAWPVFAVSVRLKSDSGSRLGGGAVADRPVQAARSVAGATGEPGHQRDEGLLDGQVDPLDLALAVRGERREAVNGDAQRGHHVLDGGGGEP